MSSGPISISQSYGTYGQKFFVETKVSTQGVKKSYYHEFDKDELQKLRGRLGSNRSKCLKTLAKELGKIGESSYCSFKRTKDVRVKGHKATCDKFTVEGSRLPALMDELGSVFSRVLRRDALNRVKADNPKIAVECNVVIEHKK